jgi:uncharacterized protein YjiS (DUF1127 family)
MEMIMSTTVGTPDSSTGWVRAQGSGLVATVKTWWMSHLIRRIERVAIMQLNAMSDRELHDIGLTRAGIEWAVRSEPDHRPRIPHYRRVPAGPTV